MIKRTADGGYEIEGGGEFEFNPWYMVRGSVEER